MRFTDQAGCLNPPRALPMPHLHPHAFRFLNADIVEGLTVSRRNLLKAGFAGFGGLTLPGLLQARDAKRATGATSRSFCCGWPAGRARSTRSTPSPTGRPRTAGRSASPRRNCPASSSASTCRSSPRCSTGSPIIRSVDCRHSNHEPNTVMQTANLLAEPRDQPRGPQLPGDRLAGGQVPRRQPPGRCRRMSRS